jgi:phage repressor protein C with HTH and peptisase S24 domain
MKQKDIALWLERSLAKSGKTQTFLAREIGLTPDKISNIIRLRREMTAGEAMAAAKVLDVPLPSENRTILVMGYVGAGAEVIPINDGDSLAEVELDVPVPWGTVGAIVRGDSMYPIFEDGDLIAYGGEHLSPEQAVGTTCIVQLSDGRMMIKRVRRGSSPGLYTLTSTNAPDIEDVPLEWAREFVLRMPRKFWRKS